MQLHTVQAERLVRVEAARETMEKRLSEGAETFSELRTSVVNLRKEITDSAPKPLPRWQLLAFILGPVLGVVVLVGSIVWQAARTPNRDEFTKLQEQVQALEITQVRISAQLDELGSAILGKHIVVTP